MQEYLKRHWCRPRLSAVLSIEKLAQRLDPQIRAPFSSSTGLPPLQLPHLNKVGNWKPILMFHTRASFTPYGPSSGVPPSALQPYMTAGAGAVLLIKIGRRSGGQLRAPFDSHPAECSSRPLIRLVCWGQQTLRLLHRSCRPRHGKCLSVTPAPCGWWWGWRTRP
jgi:hypothetical protein